MDYLYSPPDFQLAEMCGSVAKRLRWQIYMDKRYRLAICYAVAFIYSILGEQVRGFTRLAESPRLMMSSTYMVSGMIKLTTLANILFGYYFFYARTRIQI